MRILRVARAAALVLAIAGFAACTFTSKDSSQEVQDAVRAYFDAVNRADPTAIMSQYSRKAEATSVFEGDIVRGWDQIRRETDKMAGTAGEEKWAPGTMEVLFLGHDHALVVVPVNITLRSSTGHDELEGASTLVMEKVDGKWVILHEHHSVKPADDEDESYDSRRS